MLAASDGSKLFSIIDNDDVDSCIEYMKLNPSSLNSYFINYGMFGSYRHCMTPLHYSLKKNAIKCSHFLLESENIDVNLPILCSCGNCENKHSTAIYFAQSEELIDIILKKCNKIDNYGCALLYRTACSILSTDLITFWNNYIIKNKVIMTTDWKTDGLKEICKYRLPRFGKPPSFDAVTRQKWLIEHLIDLGADFTGGNNIPFHSTPLGLCFKDNYDNKQDLINFYKNIYKKNHTRIPTLSQSIPIENICTLTHLDGSDQKIVTGMRMSILLKLFHDIELNDKSFPVSAESYDFFKGLMIHTILMDQYGTFNSPGDGYICEVSVMLSPGISLKTSDLVPLSKGYFSNPDIIRLSHNTVLLDGDSHTYNTSILINSASVHMNTSVRLDEQITKDTLCYFDLIYLTNPLFRMCIASNAWYDNMNNMKYYSGCFSKIDTYDNKYTLVDTLKSKKYKYFK